MIKNNEAEFFESQMNAKLLAAERLRMDIMTVGLGFPLVLLVLIPRFYPGQVRAVFHGGIPDFASWLVVLGFLYALFMRFLLARQEKMGKGAWTGLRYLDALLETSIPTAIILAVCGIFRPVYALLAPPSFIYFIFIALSALRMDFRLCVFTGAVAAVQYMGLAWYFLQHSDLSGMEPMLANPIHYASKSFALLLCGVAAGFATRMIRRQVGESLDALGERNRVVGLFGQHVSTAVVDKILSQRGGAESEARKVCVMFLDIRGFTKFSEHRRPAEVVAYLNRLFGEMTEIVNRRHGVINKFLGDGFMAVFGAPLSEGNDCLNAVKAAQEIALKVSEMAAQKAIPSTAVGMGLHYGPVVAGNIGSNLRKEYTIIGDTVNLASRIEQLNKQFGSTLLLSREAWAKAGKPKGAKALGRVAVKGRRRSVQVYQLA